MTRCLVFLPLLLGCLTGCIRHIPYNSNCEWPPDIAAGALNLRQSAQQEHLSEDAERAEDLAIRYSDAHHRVEGIRDHCMASLFSVIAHSHSLTEDQVRRSLGHRPIGFDLLIMLSFVVLYAWTANRIARWLCSLPGYEDLSAKLMITAFASAVVSMAGVLSGEQWAIAMESYRLSTGHLSYRLERIPWTSHRLELFLAGVFLFSLIAALQYRRGPRPERSAASSFTLLAGL